MQPHPLSIRHLCRRWALALLVVILTACGGGNDDDAASPIEPRAPAPNEPQAPVPAAQDSYDYYLTGSDADAGPYASGTQMLVMMGGGEEVDEAFHRMIARAGGTGGSKVDAVIIRTSGADGYNDYLFEMDGVDSVESLVIKTREAADNPRVNAIVARADLLFIAGGDQSTYIKLWKGTALDQTLKDLRARKVPFGGTSAGLAVLGDVDYTGENESITSAEALADPYDTDLTLDTGFITGLPGLEGAITDTHLQARDRMGRLLGFLARMIHDGLSPLGTARGIGVEEDTALVVDGDDAVVLGPRAAYFVKPGIVPTTVQAGTPLDFMGVRVDKLVEQGGSFNLATWTRSTPLAPYHLNVNAGVLSSDQAGNEVY